MGTDRERTERLDAMIADIEATVAEVQRMRDQLRDGGRIDPALIDEAEALLARIAAR
jgi:hypothetical protein